MEIRIDYLENFNSQMDKVKFFRIPKTKLSNFFSKKINFYSEKPGKKQNKNIIIIRKILRHKLLLNI